MRRLGILVLMAAGFGLLAPAQAAKKNPEIRLNQVGYYPRATKIAIIANPAGDNFALIEAHGSQVVLTGKLKSAPPYPDAGETSLAQADFSSWERPGRYQLRLDGGVMSAAFVIDPGAWRSAALASLKSYYYQRSSSALSKTHAGVFARPAGHLDQAVARHASAGPGAPVASPGGWYDAGDFGKYIINAGITTATLMQLHHLAPQYFRDGSLEIPESGNGISDLLDEVKVELDWMKTMQDQDGSVFVKLTTLVFPGMIMPHQDDAARYLIGKSTPAALDFAAVMAMAARIYEPIAKPWAADCLERAKRAWRWALAHPGMSFTNPPDVKTGEYGDQELADEWLWAAAELAITTGDKEYLERITRDPLGLDYTKTPSWDRMQPVAVLSLAMWQSGLPKSLRTRIAASIVTYADRVLAQMQRSPYRLPEFPFVWGSNAEPGNIAVVLLLAYELTQREPYLEAAAELGDYLFGRNATGYAFLTGFGSKTSMHPHHRQTAADQIAQPIPGFVIGGPNSGRQDSSDVQYPRHEPALSYVDVTGSYASNEVAINWNAPWTLVLALVDSELGRGKIPESSKK